jgi:hypothetical protein
LQLIRCSLDARVMDQSVVIERYEGTPQGGPSPLLANVSQARHRIEATNAYRALLPPGVGVRTRRFEKLRSARARHSKLAIK